MAPNRVVQLSSIIAESTRKVDDHLSTNGLPSPSFDASTPHGPPAAARHERGKGSCTRGDGRAQALLLGPMPKIFHDLIHLVSSPAQIEPRDISNTSQPTSLTSLNAIARLKFANSFSPSQTTTVTALADHAGLDHGDTDRLVRPAIASRLLLEPSPGVTSRHRQRPLIPRTDRRDVRKHVVLQPTHRPSNAEIARLRRTGPNSLEPHASHRHPVLR